MKGLMSNWVSFSCSFNEDERGIVAVSMKNIEENSCVKFRLATVMDNDWVEINDTIPDSCHATVGFRGPGYGKHNVNLGATGCFTKSIIVHEFLHLLGVSHEQVRPDRDQYLTVNWTNMQVSKNNLFTFKLTRTSDFHQDVRVTLRSVTNIWDCD